MGAERCTSAPDMDCLVLGSASWADIDCDQLFNPFPVSLPAAYPLLHAKNLAAPCWFHSPP